MPSYPPAVTPRVQRRPDAEAEIKTADRALTQAELMALGTTPITVVAAEDGHAVLVLGAYFYAARTAAYDAGADDAEYVLQDGEGNALTATAAVDMMQTGAAWAHVAPVSSLLDGADLAGASVDLAEVGVGDDLTGGAAEDADSARIVVTYQRVKV